MNTPLIPWEILPIAALLLVNRLAMPLYHRRVWVYWVVQGLNAATLGGAIIFGVRGGETDLVAGLLVGAVLLFHLVQNVAIRQRHELAETRESNLREHMRVARDLRDDNLKSP